MDLDGRFRPNNGLGGRIILLGDGTEISADATDGDMFDNEEEDKDLDSQVNKYNEESSDRKDREATPGPNSSSTTAAQVTESPSSVQTEKSDDPEQGSKGTDADNNDKKPEASTTTQTSEK